jgi:predicted HAD superfamily phosphohydrolase YqeG
MLSSDYHNLGNKITEKAKKWRKEIRLKLETVCININKTESSVTAFVQCVAVVVVSCLK